MKRKIFKKALALCLVLSMTVGMFPVGVLAAETIGTVARGTYMDAEGNTQNYEIHFDTPLELLTRL